MSEPRFTDGDYREAAKRMHGDPGVSVSQWAAVQRVEGGAFVEVIVWVPDAEAHGISEERVFNEKGPACAR